MKRLVLIAATWIATPWLVAQVQPGTVQACWLETSSAPMDGALGGSGLEHTKVWNSTISAVLLKNPHGDVLVDTGLSPDAEGQMNELPPAGRAFGMQVVAGAKDRKSLLTLLTDVNEPPGKVSAIVLTHTHYDHLGGATTLQAPIYIPATEINWAMDQAAHPTITPPSLVNATKTRFIAVRYDSGPFLGFAASKDFYGDGSIVLVPLPGHTPGSQGLIAQIGGRRLFLIGDAADTLEAAERGLPKSSPIRSATDTNPNLADQTTQQVAAFHRAHPEIALIPAHDRQAYLAEFPGPESCTAKLPKAKRTE